MIRESKEFREWATSANLRSVEKDIAFDAWQACAEVKDKEIAELREALQFYADGGHYYEERGNTFCYELGVVARKALNQNQTIAQQ